MKLMHFIIPRVAVTLAVAALLAGKPQAQATATFVINNLDSPGEGFNDPTPWVPAGGNPATTVGQARLMAFQFAANIWGSYLNSTVTIQIDASFDPLFCTTAGAVLGSAGAATLQRDFGSTLPYPPPAAATWYPQALANAIRGADVNPGAADIRAQFSSTFGTPGCGPPGRSWYYGLDGNPPPGGIDLVTVLLHEFAHGLGFASAVNLATGTKALGLDDTYMRFLESHGATPGGYPAMTDAQRLAASVSDPNLHWLGTEVWNQAAALPLAAGFPGGHVQMFAPNPAQPGSSVSHFHTSLSPNELMEPVHTGATRDLRLTLALLRDIGWQVNLPDGDLFMRDTPLDAGLERNPDTGDMYVSQDIYVRNTADGTLVPNVGVHQNPSYSPVAPNYVYVRVHNRGALPASGVLKVYWSKAATSMVWPAHWVNNITTRPGCSATLFGDQIATGSPLLINNLAPGADAIIEVPWLVPNPADYACFGDPHHFCLLARIETESTPPYGMHEAETTDIVANVRNNNNIVWKNVTVVSDTPGLLVGAQSERTLIRNSGSNQATANLRFRLTNLRNQSSFFQYGTVDVKLDAQLMSKWLQGNAQGQGIQYLNTNTIRLLSSNATIANLVLDPGEWHVLGLEFGISNRPALTPPAVFDLNLTQTTVGGTNEEVAGGVVFALNLNHVSLFSFGSVWKYNDTGSDLGAAWRGLNYADANWGAGPGQLGFGDGDEATVINGGPATNRFRTTYLRRTFNVDAVSNVSTLTFQLKRDDGAVVYLNGTEVFRNNMPTGAISFSTLASSSAPDDGNAIIHYTVPASAVSLLTGQNLVAVEIHQDSATSSDLSFDLALVANHEPVPPQVAITTPVAGGPISVLPFLVTADAYDTDGGVAKVEFFANLTKLGEITAPPFELVVSNIPPGTYCLSARVTDNLGMTNVSAPVEAIVMDLGSALPMIVQQPLGQTLTEGDPLTLSVEATGAQPLSYQWFKDGSPLAGITIQALHLPQVSPADGGAYAARVTNPYGQAISSNAVVRINPRFQGIANSPLGGAILTAQPGELVVSNIGPQGVDGVALDLTGMHFGTVTIGGMNPNLQPPGAAVTMRVFGEVNSLSNQLIGTLRAVNAGSGGVTYSADFNPIGGVANTVMVFDGSNLVATAHSLTGAVASVAGATAGDQWIPYLPAEGRPWAVIDFPTRPVITLAGGLPVSGTRLAISPEANKLTFPGSPIIVTPRVTITWPWWVPWYKPTFPWPFPPWPGPGPDPSPIAIGALGRIEVLAQNMAELRILREQPGMFGFVHQLAGPGGFQGGSDRLWIADPGTNILGSGVEWPAQPGPISHPCYTCPQCCPGPLAFKAGWLNPDPAGVLSVGSFLKANITGTLGNNANQQLGFLQAQKTLSNTVAFVADFAPAGSTQSVVQVYRDGLLVHSSFAVNGIVVGTAFNWPIYFNGPFPPCDPRVCDPSPLDLSFGWLSKVLIRLHDGSSILGDRIRIYGNPSPQPSLKFDRFGLLIGGGLSSLAIIKEDALPGGQIFGGLAHLPLGAASLTTTSNELVVANSSSNSSFGTAIALGEAGGGVVAVIGPDDTAPNGSEVRVRAVGTLEGVPEQLLGELIATKAGTNVVLSADLTPWDVQYVNITIMDGPSVVGVAAGVRNPTVIIPSKLRLAWLAGPWQLLKNGFVRTHIDLSERSAICPWNPTNTPVPVPPPVFGTRIIFDACLTCSDPNPRPNLKDVLAISRFDVLGRGLGSFRLLQERLGQFGQLHGALGAAQLSGAGADLHVRNLVSGPANPDGLEFPLEHASQFNAFWRPLDPWSQMPTGAMFRASARGAFVNGPEKLLGSIQINHLGFTREISADYSPVGAPSRRIEVLRSNLVVFTTSLGGGTGAVARVPDWPLGCGKTSVGPNGPLLCFWLRFWPETTFEINNQSPKGDQIRILTENVGGTLDHFSLFSLQAAGLESLDLVSAGTETGNPATLQIQSFGDALAISWTPTAADQILQSADSLTGPWTPVVGPPASPYVTAPGGVRKFFRVVQP